MAEHGDETKAETKKGQVTERTAAWPDVTPHRPSSFNRVTKVPVVKTTAKKFGID